MLMKILLSILINSGVRNCLSDCFGFNLIVEEVKDLLLKFFIYEVCLCGLTVAVALRETNMQPGINKTYRLNP